MRFYIFALSFLWLTGCGENDSLHRTQSYIFGTMVDITIYEPNEQHARQAAEQVMHDFQQIHHQLHAWQASEITLLNQKLHQGESTTISRTLIDLLEYAKQLSVQSEGLFNPAIGELIAAWGFQRDEFAPQIPESQRILVLLTQNPRMTDIDIKKNNITSTNKAVKLDFGGYAKGYALDLARDRLHAMHIQHALINIGGNIIAMGMHGKKFWRVGIQHPRQPNAMATLNLPDGWAIGTSGDYQRYFEKNGKRYCHVIDPRNGYPVTHTQAVTVLIPPSAHAGVLSDVASKPIFIADVAEKPAMATKMGVAYYLWVDANGEIVVSPQMAKLLHWEDANAAKRVRILPS